MEWVEIFDEVTTYQCRFYILVNTKEFELRYFMRNDP